MYTNDPEAVSQSIMWKLMRWRLEWSTPIGLGVLLHVVVIDLLLERLWITSDSFVPFRIDVVEI